MVITKAKSLKQALSRLLVSLLGGHRQRWATKRRLYLNPNPAMPAWRARRR